MVVLGLMSPTKLNPLDIKSSSLLRLFLCILALFGSQTVALGQIDAYSVAANKGRQLEFGFVDELADSSGLVIGRGRHIDEALDAGAFAPGEYRLSWFSTLPSNRRATLPELDLEWSINKSYLQDVMQLNRPIRDVSPIDDVGGFFLNRERDTLGGAGWNYADGWWNPPTP